MHSSYILFKYITRIVSMIDMTRIRRIETLNRIFFVTFNLDRSAKPLQPAERTILLSILHRHPRSERFRTLRLRSHARPRPPASPSQIRPATHDHAPAKSRNICRSRTISPLHPSSLASQLSRLHLPPSPRLRQQTRIHPRKSESRQLGPAPGPMALVQLSLLRKGSQSSSLTR
jgi:hypothetical protein